MSFFEFPYTRTYADDLGWIIRQLEYVTKEVHFKTIKYADPLDWNITMQYEQNTVVVDPNTGTAYLSVQAVPSGVSITNTDYWTVIFDLSRILNSITGNLTLHDNGDSPTLIENLYEGDWLIWNNELYITLVNMTIGTALLEGTNVAKKSVEQLVKLYVDNLIAVIGILANLTTTDKTSIVNAINDVNASCATIVSRIGDLDTLTTTDKTSVVNAINDVNASCATILSNLNALTLRVDALEVHDPFKYKRIILHGDSYAVENADGSWAADVYTMFNPNPDQMYKIAMGGAGFIGNTGGKTLLESLQDYLPNIANPSTITDIYVMAGYNDISATKAQIISAIGDYLDYCATVFPNAIVHIGMIAWGKRGDNATLATLVLPAYIEGAFSRRNGAYITGIENANHDLANIKAAPDLIHPNPTANKFIAAQLFNFIKGDDVNVFFNNLPVSVTVVNDNNGVAPSVYTNSWHTHMKNDITDIVCNGFNVIWTNGITIPGDAFNGGFKKIGDMSGGNLFGYYESSEFSVMIPFKAIISEVGVNVFNNYDGWICFANGGIFLGVTNFVGGSPTNLNAKQILLTPFSYSFPSVKA